MSHVEETEGLFDTVTADLSVLSRLLGTVREVKRAEILEENVATHGKTFVEYSP
jgi:hypothetical protein